MLTLYLHDAGGEGGNAEPNTRSHARRFCNTPIGPVPGTFNQVSYTEATYSDVSSLTNISLTISLLTQKFHRWCWPHNKAWKFVQGATNITFDEECPAAMNTLHWICERNRDVTMTLCISCLTDPRLQAMWRHFISRTLCWDEETGNCLVLFLMWYSERWICD